MRPTLKHIAEHLGVSVMTVSRALRNGPGVRHDTGERIRSYARSVNYQPDLAARSLVARRSSMLGLVVSNLRLSFWNSILAGLEESVLDAGYHVFLSHSGGKPSREAAVINAVVGRRVDALIVASCAPDCNAPLLRRLMSEGTPVVLLDRYAPEIVAPGVFSDNVGGARAATEHLLSLGRRRIAHFAGDMSYSPARDRLQGYRDAMAAAGLEPMIVGATSGQENWRQAALDLLDGMRPDAIFAFHDVAAIDAMMALHERGVRVPEDVALVGFSDSGCCLHVRIPLTSVSQGTSEIGRRVAEMVLRRIAGESLADPRVIVPTKLIVRQSTTGLSS